jgi:hypothetical protein
MILIIDNSSLEREALATQLRLITRDNYKILKLNSLDEAKSNLGTETTMIFIDVFSFPIKDSIRFIGTVRNTYPWIPFILYVWSENLLDSNNGLSEDWQRRFGHYYRIYKDFVASHELTSIVQTITLHALSYYKDGKETFKNLLITPVNSPAESVAKPFVKPSTSKIFTSYSRSDSVFVDWLWQELESRNIQIWVDRKDIKAGENWADAVDSALKSSQVMLLVLSPASMSSKNVKQEWMYMMDTGKVVVPILWQDCEKHFKLYALQHIDCRDYHIEGLEELVQLLKSYQSFL